MDKYINAIKFSESLRCMAEVQPPFKQSTILGVVSTIESYPAADVVPKEQIQQLFTEIDTALEHEAFDFGTRMRIQIYLKNLKQKYLGGNDDEMQ